MDRKLYLDSFSSCTSNLDREITELADIQQEMNRVLTNDGASEFSNAYLREQYNIILQSINDKNYSISNHRNFLGNKKEYLNQDDSDKATSMDLLMDDFEIVRTKIHQMAQDIYESALTLAGGDIGIDAIISREELSVSIAINEELGNLTYAKFISMTEEDRNKIVNRAIDLANQYVLDGTLPIPESGRIELPIALGVTIYSTCSTYNSIGNNVVSVDYNSASKDACVHILGGDVFANTDVSIDTSMKYGITYTKSIEDEENASIYVASGYDVLSNAFFAEKGVNVTMDIVTENGVSINATCTVGCGVEVSCPSGWTPKPEPAPVPVVAVNYNLIPDFDEQWVPSEVVVLGALLLIGGATTLGRLLLLP